MSREPAQRAVAEHGPAADRDDGLRGVSIGIPIATPKRNSPGHVDTAVRRCPPGRRAAGTLTSADSSPSRSAAG
jgi:hypothetical protein